MKRDPKSIEAIITALKASPELRKQFDEAKLWEKWPEIAGPKLMAFGRPLGVRDGTLFIEVDSAVWMHRFSYFEQEIASRANLVAGREWVSDLFFKLTSEEKLEHPQQDVGKRSK